MPTFLYKAKKADGEVVGGALSAESLQGAISRLDGMSLYPLDIREESRGRETTSRPTWWARRRVTSDDLVNLFRQLSDLLGAGVPLLSSLTLIENQAANPRLAGAISSIKGDVAEGSHLAEALGRHDEIFTTLQVNMIRAGEAGGFLESSLSRIAEFGEKRAALRSRIVSALIYPAVLACAGFASVVFLITYVVPKIITVFNEAGGALPMPTRILLGIDSFLKRYWLLLAGGIMLVTYLLKRFLASERGRLARDRAVLVFPVMGDLFQKLILSRFSRTLGTLLRNGVPMLESLAIAREATGSEVLRREVALSADSVREGQGLADPLRQSFLFPAVMVEMVAVSEQSGNLSEVLLRIADKFETELDHSLDRLVALLEAVVIMLMAGVVGFVVIAVLLPVFTASSMIG